VFDVVKLYGALILFVSIMLLHKLFQLIIEGKNSFKNKIVRVNVIKEN
jgi:hypothetical protein